MQDKRYADNVVRTADIRAVIDTSQGVARRGIVGVHPPFTANVIGFAERVDALPC